MPGNNIITETSKHQQECLNNMALTKEDLHTILLAILLGMTGNSPIIEF